MNKNNNGADAERGHKLAYFIWDTDNREELDHLVDVFNSCMKIRREQFRVMERVMKQDGLRVSYTLIGDKDVDIKER